MTEMMEPLGNDEENLHRQVNPSWIHEGGPSSQAFCPTPKDNGQLSVDRGSISTAQESFERFVANDWASVGVWAVTVGETRNIGLKTFPDPDPGWSNPAHAYVHFSDLPKNKAKKKAQVLAAHARARGCVYAPDTGSSTE